MVFGSYLVSNIKIDSFPSTSDHCVVTAATTYRMAREMLKEKSFLLDSGRRYHQLDFTKAPWPDIKRRLGLLDWLPIESLAKTDVKAAHSLFVETVLPVIEELVPIMKFGKRKVDKERRILLRRLGKVRKRLATTKSIPRATSLLLSQQKLEKELMMSHDTQGFEDENKVVNGMKVNPKA